MAELLEVIVTSLEEAIDAEAGGADRLELVRDLAVGGLTPRIEAVEAVLDSVALPVRIMLREEPTMAIQSAGELEILQGLAERFSKLPIDGLVMGYLRDGAIDMPTMAGILAAAPQSHVTFHRAFDELKDPLASVDELKRFPQIDRILTAGGIGDWHERKQRLLQWQRAAKPSITILVGAGICPAVLQDLRNTPELHEIHVGRSARLPQSVSGRVRREAVRALKSVLP
ncbi:MAG: hypothetical protein M3Y72_22370 [Acidobacteriota bacterium]|nr:hypothetical protein [Acidobacteriota bacterium]